MEVCVAGTVIVTSHTVFPDTTSACVLPGRIQQPRTCATLRLTIGLVPGQPSKALGFLLFSFWDISRYQFMHVCASCSVMGAA